MLCWKCSDFASFSQRSTKQELNSGMPSFSSTHNVLCARRVNANSNRTSQGKADAAATAADSVRTLDAQLYRSLLARARRWRLRDGLAAVSREPGRGALIAFTDDDLFSEANLFAPAWVPDWVGVEPWRPTPNPGNTTGVIAHALQVGRWPGCTIAVTAEHIGVHLTSQAVPDAEPMWADLAQDLIAGGGPSPTVSILAIDTGTARPQPPAQTANLQTGPHVG